MSKQYNQALALAHEYRRLREAGRTAEAQQARQTILQIIGRYDGQGSMVLPQSIEEAMGADAYGDDLNVSPTGARRGVRPEPEWR